VDKFYCGVLSEIVVRPSDAILYNVQRWVCVHRERCWVDKLHPNVSVSSYSQSTSIWQLLSSMIMRRITVGVQYSTFMHLQFIVTLSHLLLCVDIHVLAVLS